MNPISKVCCRIYQTAFRLALPLLPYREPKILRSVLEIQPLLTERKISSVLLVTDKILRGKGLTAVLEEMLQKNNISCTVYDGTCPNPTVANAEEAKTLYFQNRCECIVAMGGGSAMDCAKAVGALVAYPQKSLNQLKGLLRVLRKIPLLIAIPTTAGTGSEVTLAAVITDPERKHKYTMNDFTLIPSYAVLDPELTFSLPPALTAATGMDALTHAVEAYIGRSTSRETRKMALTAVKLIFGNIEKTYLYPTDRTARSAMLHAAYCAGIAFSKSYVGYIHAVAHSLGGQYNIPHGLANAVLLPCVLDGYGTCAEKKLRDLAVAAGVADDTSPANEAAMKFIQSIRKLNRNMGIPETLAGIDPEDIPLMARHASREANPLYPVPKLMTAAELERFYYEVYDRRAEK